MARLRTHAAQATIIDSAAPQGQPDLLVSAIRLEANCKIELTLSEEEGQEDRIIDKLLGEAVKNVFEAYFDPKQLRAVVDSFESGKTFLTGDRMPSADYVKRLGEMPALKKEVTAFLKRIEQPDAGDALVASAVELILEGLHVENRLNRNVKAGQVTFKR